MIYLAYGSNLHIGQMQRRCPTAEVLGTSTLHGYRLVFNGVATIEPDPDRSVPVLLWQQGISPMSFPLRYGSLISERNTSREK